MKVARWKRNVSGNRLRQGAPPVGCTDRTLSHAAQMQQPIELVHTTPSTCDALPSQNTLYTSENMTVVLVLRNSLFLSFG